jgi:hypothetical protein
VSAIGEPLKPPEGEEVRTERPMIPDINKRPDLLDPEADRFVAGTERARVETDLLGFQTRADVTLEKDKADVVLRLLEKDAEAKISNEVLKAKGEVSDKAVKAVAEREKTEAETKEIEAKTKGRERRDRATEIERYACIGLAAIGVIAAIILAFRTAGQPLEYHLAPLPALFASGGAGWRLRTISARSASEDDDQGQDQEQKDDGNSESGAA